MKKITNLQKVVIFMTIFSTLSVMAAEFKFVHVLEQSYWYSRYNLGNLVMRSGNGQTFMPKMEMMKKMIELVSDDLSTAMVPKNPALIKRIYNQGNPSFINSSNRDMHDFSNFRWVQASSNSNQTTTLQAFGWTLLKEVEWSKQFNVDFHFGSPNIVKVPGAQQRFAGLVLCTESLVQAKELAMNPQAFDASDIGGQYVALAAVSDLSQYLSTTSTTQMKTNRCAMVAKMMNKKPALEVSATFLKLANKLYSNAAAPVTIREKSLAIQALVWYAFANKSKRAELLTQIKTIGNSLVKVKSNDPVELSYLIRAMIEVNRMTGSSRYLKVVSRNYKRLAKDFNSQTGIFKSTSTYSTEDIATILGAMNAMKIFAGSRVNQTELLATYINFFNTVLNKAKMQISAPPVKLIAAYERRADHLMHRSPLLPMPPMAGAKNGIAPVFAASISYDGGSNSFSNESNHFDTAGAMHLANEMIWVHHEQVNGFPEF